MLAEKFSDLFVCEGDVHCSNAQGVVEYMFWMDYIVLKKRS